MKSPNGLKPHQSSLIVATVATVIGFLIPGVQRALLPLQYLNTHLHELSHAMTAILTGAQVERIVVNSNGSGETPVAGGILLLIASAGYVGASMFGAGMIYASRTERGARGMLWALTCLLTFSMIVWVRGDSVGEIAGIGWIVVLAMFATTLKGKPLLFCTQFIGIQQCLNSLTSLLTLVQLSMSTEVHSDATILYDATGIPPVIWALGWSGFSLGLVLWTLRKSWAPAPGRGG